MGDAQSWGPAVAVVAFALANLLAWACNPHSLVHKRLLSRCGLPALFWCSSRAEGVDRRALPRSYWSFDVLNPEHLVHSPLLGVAGLLVLNAVTVLYWLATVLVDVGRDWYGWGCSFQNCFQRTAAYPEWMSYLTNWSLSLLGIAGLVGFINTARFEAARVHQRHAASPPPTAAASGQQQGRRQPELELAGHPSGPPGHSPDAQHRLHGGSRPQDTCPGTLDSSSSSSRPPAAIGGATVAPRSSDGSNSTSTDGGGRSDTVVTVCDAASSRSSSHAGKAPHPRWDWLSVLHCLLMEVATSAALVVTIGFWGGFGAVRGGDFNAKPGTIMAHAANLAVALLQLLLTRLPMVSTHFQVLLWYATLYSVFLWAFGEGSGTWRYKLNWREAKPAGAFILVPLVVFLLYCVWCALAAAREGVLRRHRRRHQAKQQERHQHQQQSQHTPAVPGHAAA